MPAWNPGRGKSSCNLPLPFRRGGFLSQFRSFLCLLIFPYGSSGFLFGPPLLDPLEVFSFSRVSIPVLNRVQSRVYYSLNDRYDLTVSAVKAAFYLSAHSPLVRVSPSAVVENVSFSFAHF